MQNKAPRPCGVARSGPPQLLSIVIPCYNEEEALASLLPEMERASAESACPVEWLFVNDGSSDGTLGLLLSLALQDPRVRVVDLSRNFGHQAAVSCGISRARGEVVAVMDADLQDPPLLLVPMLARWREGADVVYGVRKKRKEPFLLVSCYWLFYRLLKLVADFPIPPDSGDFCLMDRRVVEVLQKLPERQRFIRGLRAWAGFRQEPLEYERAERRAGRSKYSLLRLVRLSFDGLFGFSFAPLRLVLYLGMVTCAFSVAGIAFLLLHRLLNFPVFGYLPSQVPGYTTLAILLLLMFGIQMVSLGVIGEYIGRIFIEAKGRPLFVVRAEYPPEASETGRAAGQPPGLPYGR